ncbi:MAG: porin [Gammaproteobacteria bacterium]|nr:porin [Gammaproteobacteria bacterium]
MKKSILALAVAASLAIPLVVEADTILYGSARVSVDYNDEKVGALDKALGIADPDGNWNIVNNASRLGVQGFEELGGGLSAVYQYEFGVDATEGGNFEGNRPKFVGLRGDFGTLTVGTQDTPYYNVAGITDIFNTDKSFGSTVWLGGSFNGFDIDLSTGRAVGGGALFRLENSLYYITPNFNGFTAEGMLVMNGSDNDAQGYSNGIDIWNLAGKYVNGPFFAGVSYIKLEGKNNIALTDGTLSTLDLDQWVLGLGYSQGPFAVGFIYERGDFNTFSLLSKTQFSGEYLFGNDDADNWYLTGQYSFGNNTVRAAYGRMNTSLKSSQAIEALGIHDDDTIDNYLIGYEYNFSKRTRVWAEYIGRDANTLLNGDQNAFSIGTRVDF